MSFIGIPLAIVIMLTAQRVERRLGSAAAGWVAALPISFAVASATLAITQSHHDASVVAVSAAGHLAAQISFAMAFVWFSSRTSVIATLSLAILTYAVISLGLVPIPYLARIAIGIAMMVVGTFFMSKQPRPAPSNQKHSAAQRVISLMSAALVVTIITVANHFAGPVIAGALGAFPTMSTTIALFVARRSNLRSASGVMKGLVLSLPCYLTYCVVFAASITRASVFLSVLVAGVTALVVAGATWRGVAQKHTPSEGVVVLTGAVES